MMLSNCVIAPLLTDAYKLGHADMEPEGTEQVYSNFTCRSSKWAKVLFDFNDKVVVANTQAMVQYLLRDYWNKTFFSQNKSDVINIYKSVVDSIMGKDVISMKNMEALHDLGYLPIHVKSLPDGSCVNIRVAYLYVLQPMLLYMVLVLIRIIMQLVIRLEQLLKQHLELFMVTLIIYSRILKLMTV